VVLQKIELLVTVVSVIKENINASIYLKIKRAVSFLLRSKPH